MTTDTDPRVAEAMRLHLKAEQSHADWYIAETETEASATLKIMQADEEAFTAYLAAEFAKVPSAPVEAVAWEWRIDGGNWIPCNESGAKHFAKQPGCEWRALGVIAPASAPVEAVPVEAVPVTDAMVTAYLQANDSYWRETDELPTPPDKWRTGTPRGATFAGLRAALALAITPPQAESSPTREELQKSVDILSTWVDDLRAELREVRKDAVRIDHLQNSGSTVELVPMAGEHKHGFRIGGLHKTVSHDIRKAIDAAMTKEKP